jgi:hypothetical protein
LAATIQITASASSERADCRRTFAADSAADASAERRSAQDRSRRARSALEITPRCFAIESVKASAASAYGRALLASDQRPYERATANYRRRPGLATEARTPAAILRGNIQNGRSRQHQTHQKHDNSLHTSISLKLLLWKLKIRERALCLMPETDSKPYSAAFYASPDERKSRFSFIFQARRLVPGDR